MITLTVNGTPRSLDPAPRTHLADALRETLNLTGTHLGCEQGVCGACTVLVDGRPQRACLTFAVECDGAAVTTIEGFGADPTMAALREAFSAHHALQCGFCTPGMLISARDIVLRLGEIPEMRLREELSGNLCRCTGYVGIVEAVQAVAAGRTPQPATAPAPVAARAASGPVETIAVAAPTAVRADAELEERIPLAAAPGSAWAVLSDLQRVVACLPGATLDSLDGTEAKGSVAIALGPVRARFAGTGTVTLDDATKTGTLSGRGRDGGSSAEGTVTWQVLPADTGSTLAVRLGWRLTGPLAQFGRAGLVQDLVRRLARDFAANLDAMIAGQAPRAAQPVGLFALIWSILRTRLFGR